MKVHARPFTVGTLCLFALVAIAGPHTYAGGYPNKPIKIITQAPAGAGPDVILRIVADRLTQRWGQQVLVINRPGGGGLIAAQAAAATSERDGYTLYMASSSALVVLPEIHAKLPFSFDRDFVPLGLIGKQPFVIAVAPSLKIGTLAELLAMAKERPGAMTYAANLAGTLPHLVGEYFRYRSGIDIRFVPYTGGAPAALKEVMSGLVPVIIDSLAALSGAIQGDAVKPLAVSSLQRLPQYPNLSTIAETIPNFEAEGWFALLAPTGISDTVIEKVSRDLQIVLGHPELQQKFAALGTFVHPMKQSELLAFIRNEQQMWKPIVRKAGIEPQ